MLITPHAAAELIALDYEGALHAQDRLDIDGVQSAIVAPPGHQIGLPIMVIRGSDERLDWIRNFRFWPDAEPGDTVFWHRGFLTHARIAYGFAKEKGVGTVIGHSLGAACTQIVAPSLGVPGIALASPRPLYAPDELMPRPANEALVQNWCRTDDAVCRVPPDGFCHVGTVHWLTPARRSLGFDHSARLHYLPLLKNWIVAPQEAGGMKRRSQA